MSRMPRNSTELIARANAYRSPRNLVAQLAPGGLVTLFNRGMAPARVRRWGVVVSGGHELYVGRGGPRAARSS